MALQLNQTLRARGYVTDAKFVYGPVSSLESKLGYHGGRLNNGFYIGCLLRLPDAHEFELAGYSITPEHKFKTPQGYDINKLKELARDAMIKAGGRNIVKIFPNTGHNSSMSADDQYPIGDGVPQWKLVKELPFQIIKEFPANFAGSVSLH
jgi:hypothetical protein